MQLKNAFTLVELVMVVAIIGMIALFALPSYTKTVSRSYEKAAGNNLLIVYSAQKIRNNSGSGYVAAANTAAVNTNLNLGIIGNGFTYSCSLPTATTFNCRAAYTAGTAFTLQITDSNQNICCAAGTCPSVPNVGVSPC